MTYDDNNSKYKKTINAFDNIMRTSAKYDNNKEAEKYLKNQKTTEDYLRENLIEKMKTKPLDSSEVRFLMDTKPEQPKATPKQMQELKRKFAKYRYIHGEDKPKNKSAVLSIPKAKIDTTPSALNNAPIRSAENLEREQKFKQLVKEIEDEKNRIRYSGLGALLP